MKILIHFKKITSLTIRIGFIGMLTFSPSDLVFAQTDTPIKILGAKNASMNTLDGVRILVGDVRFKQGNTYMYCDSAISYLKTNVMEAYGHVRIIDNEKGTEITGDSLTYDGKTRFGSLRGEITLNDGPQILKTKYLDFDTKKNLIYYLNGGEITNTKDHTVLNSRVGTYNTESKVFFFEQKVSYIGDTYAIFSDYLDYYTQIEMIYFRGPTDIISDSTSIYCEYGYYDKMSEFSSFSIQVEMISKDQVINADSVTYNTIDKKGEGFENVVILDSANKTEIYGDYAKYNNLEKTSLVTGHLILLVAFVEDTLQLHSDTLYTHLDSIGEHRLAEAYHHVQFFKPDMQGKCDSLLFSEIDSTIRMFGTPVVWTDSNQITGKEIEIKNYNGIIDYMYIEEEAFTVSQETPELFNQVKGNSLYAHFRKNKIYKIDIDRSGQTIYFGRDEKDKIMGMNRLTCSNMRLYFDTAGISDITFYTEPDGIFYPIKDLTLEIRVLRNFYWREDERPINETDIFNWTEVPLYIVERRANKSLK